MSLPASGRVTFGDVWVEWGQGTSNSTFVSRWRTTSNLATPTEVAHQWSTSCETAKAATVKSSGFDFPFATNASVDGESSTTNAATSTRMLVTAMPSAAPTWTNSSKSWQSPVSPSATSLTTFVGTANSQYLNIRTVLLCSIMTVIWFCSMQGIWL